MADQARSQEVLWGVSEIREVELLVREVELLVREVELPVREVELLLSIITVATKREGKKEREE